MNGISLSMFFMVWFCTYYYGVDFILDSGLNINYIINWSMQYCPAGSRWKMILQVFANKWHDKVAENYLSKQTIIHNVYGEN